MSSDILFFGCCLIHPLVHSAHVWHTTATMRVLLLFRLISDSCFGSKENSSSRYGILHASTLHLYGVDNTGSNHIFDEFSFGSVIATVSFHFLYFLHHYSTINTTGIIGNLLK